MRFLTLILIAFFLSGCTTAQMANKVADRYCSADDERKRIIGYEVNKVVAPHKLRMECANDLEEEDSNGGK